MTYMKFKNRHELLRVLWGIAALIAVGIMVYGLNLMMTHIKPEPGWPTMATWGVVMFLGGLGGKGVGGSRLDRLHISSLNGYRECRIAHRAR